MCHDCGEAEAGLAQGKMLSLLELHCVCVHEIQTQKRCHLLGSSDSLEGKLGCFMEPHADSGEEEGCKRLPESSLKNSKMKIDCRLT